MNILVMWQFMGFLKSIWVNKESMILNRCILMANIVHKCSRLKKNVGSLQQEVQSIQAF